MVDIIDWYNVGAEDAERSAAAACKRTLKLDQL